MELENMGGEQVSGFRDRWDHLGKTVHNGEDDGVSTRKWETSNNIHCYVGPGTTQSRQGSEEASGRMIRRLALCTRHTGRHKHDFSPLIDWATKSADKGTAVFAELWVSR